MTLIDRLMAKLRERKQRRAERSRLAGELKRDRETRGPSKQKKTFLGGGG